MGEQRKRKKMESVDCPLRADAEESLARSPGTPPEMKEKLPEELIHELRVHQIELEMQNEELRRVQLALEDSRSKSIDLYDFAPVGYFTFTGKALIAEVNLTGAALLGVERKKLINSRFRRFVAPEDQDLWDRHLSIMFQQGKKQSCELALKRVDGSTFYARLESIRMEVSGDAPMIRTAVVDIIDRKMVEALRESEEKYRGILENMDDVYYELDLNGNLVFFNEALISKSGYSRGELMGMNYGQYMTPEMCKRVSSVFSEIYRTGQPVRLFDYEIIMKGRQTRNFESWASLLFDSNNQPIGFRGIARDITERKRAQQHLEEQKIFYEDILHGVINGIWVTDENDVICYANRGMAIIAGIPVDKMVGVHVLTGFSVLTLKEFRPHYLQAKHSLEPEYYDAVLVITPSGQESYQSGWLIPKLKEGKFGGMICTVEDVTERKRAEETLKESEVKYRSLAASVDSMYLVNRDYIYLFMNEGHRRRFGLPLEEIIGRRYGDFHSEENAKEFAKQVREVCETGKPIIQEHRSERDGRYFLRTFSPIMDWGPAGEISEVVVVSKDITERKQAEKEVIETLQQLQETRDMLVQFEKHAAVGRLAAGVSHEILNPASIISSRLQFLEEENLSKQARENLRVCREQIQRIVKVSQDLRQSSVKQPGHLVRGDLRRVIEVGLQMTERRIKEDHVQVEYNPLPEPIPAKVAMDSLVKVMVHLILNACDAMTVNQEKRLIVTVHNPEVSSKNFSILLIVADNGHGIPAEDLNRIFDPFFTTKDPGKGTGLGLSVCKGIIQEHGGTIHAENNDMGGASFIVELPLYYP